MKYGGVFMDIAYETAVIFIFSAVIMCLSAVSALQGAESPSVRGYLYTPTTAQII